ncbi:hypothetical protein BIV60_14890 [Bacillus sp. MUM 116]|uniref:phage holin family protein n=1 Tax=Bacillus sp. MUM 116 TaxID=1678002 RepID=UPI0008F5E554|nr:phage holin family protein [Bacillus sp. MUM 116]OIK13091.1 hypothetical protein BIV60_14890 [Bacillus sp. MUM 116]
MFDNLISVFLKMIVNKSLVLGALTGTVGAFFDSMLQAKGFEMMHIYIAAALAIIVFSDYVVGVRVAKKNDSYKSSIGIAAVIRDGVIFLVNPKLVQLKNPLVEQIYERFSLWKNLFLIGYYN